MPSPFPGMDPYLEGPLWPDLHQALALELRRRLVPEVRPKYAVTLNVRARKDDPGEEELGIMYPDLELVTAQPGWAAGPDAGGVATTPATAAVAALPAIRWKQVTVEVRHVARGQLVTAAEVISPINKRGRGLARYRRKRRRLRANRVHLLEIDMIRRGTRAIAHPRARGCDYLVGLTRAGAAQTQLWTVDLRDRLPAVPVPLLPGDGDAAVDLGAAFATVYDEAGYDLSVDYAAPPPPPAFSDADAAWAAGLTAPPAGPPGPPADPPA